MGVNFPTCTQFREAITFPFCIHIIFLLLSEPLHRLALHDIFDCTHKAQHLMHHDIFDCTANALFCCTTIFLFSARMLIVRSITIFCLHRDAHLFEASRYFIISTNSFRSQKITPSSAAEGHRAKFETSTDVEVTTA
jgi:hypothetical protein